MTNIDKRFKALSFVWLLFCFFAAQHYAEHADMEGTFMRIFMYGVFAAPVWLNFGWLYLREEKPITIPYLVVATALFGAWAAYEYDQCCEDGFREELAIISAAFFLLLAYPRTVIAQKPQRQNGTGGYSSQMLGKARAMFSLPETANKYRYYGMRIGLLVIVGIALLIVMSGYAVQEKIPFGRVSSWWLDLIIFIGVAIFAKPIGFWHKLACITGALASYLALRAALSYSSVYLMRMLMALGMGDEISSALMVVRMTTVLNGVFFIAALWLLLKWLRKYRYPVI